MKKLTKEMIIEWNGGSEAGLAQYMLWALDNPEEAKKEILSHSEEE